MLRLHRITLGPAASAAFAITLAGVSACRGTEEQRSTGTGTPTHITGADAGAAAPGAQPQVEQPGQAAKEAQPGRLTEAQAWTAVEAINRNEAAKAKLAESKAQNADVKALAKRMRQGHEDAEKSEKDVSARLKTPVSPSPLADQIDTDERNTLGRLSAEIGHNFDRDYVDSEIRDHQKTLDALDHEIIPSLREPQLVSNARSLRDKVAELLDDAKRTQTKLAAQPAPQAPQAPPKK